MPRKYEQEFIQLSMPPSLVNIGWMFANKKRATNIVCLICKEEKRLYRAETLMQFVSHILDEHPEAARFLKMLGWKKMII